MRRLVLAVLALMIVAWNPARAEPSEADRRAIHDVIELQLKAFQADDATGAFAFASPGIHQRFGDADTFMALVRQGYPMVYRPRETHFGALDEEDGEIVQKVGFVGPDGVLVTALYVMEQEPDGSWRIAACIIQRTPGESA